MRFVMRPNDKFTGPRGEAVADRVERLVVRYLLFRKGIGVRPTQFTALLLYFFLLYTKDF
jgi:hypothetical protein